jgi:hypothetical protein
MRLDSTEDPLVAPILGLVQAAVNARFVVDDALFESDEAVKSTHNYPIDLLIGLGDLAMPALGCHRTRTRHKRHSAVWTDHVSTLRFTYITPACSREQLGRRWPLLDRVWQATVDAICAGHHEDYLDDAEVLADAGVIRVNVDTATKQELYADHGDFSYPAFWGEIEITWRDLTKHDTTDLSPFLSAHGQYFVEGNPSTPDVESATYTEAGIADRDGEPFELEA